MRGSGEKTKASACNGHRCKKVVGKGSDAEGDGDAEGGRHFWSVDHIVALIRAKCDQDAHMQGIGHAYARMKRQEWKWLDVVQRLKKVSVDSDADKCGKKWDNLIQQFKKVHHFNGLSEKQDFFQLSAKERTSEGFNLNMDQCGLRRDSGVHDRRTIPYTQRTSPTPVLRVVCACRPPLLRIPNLWAMGTLVQGRTTTMTGRRKVLLKRRVAQAVSGRGRARGSKLLKR
ncbi:hypothetical protein CBR_g39293 [Chara braunii]|uniref:Myb/SANT-like DNA-binding domain-containing protein n=1 Tax=Chara braunii TaxID=69332 RepID=A0A388K133_CHABU|nr:hypothetical protein CBR_g39293 [Chara braunii]|eukprot:GBG63749.1 hypothetical protein CBR_g39293 [Chara braunii]